MTTTTDSKRGLGALTLARHTLMDKDHGVGWQRDRRRALARKKANYLRNKAARANFYAENDGEINAGTIPVWHSTLNALSLGTYN